MTEDKKTTFLSFSDGSSHGIAETLNKIVGKPYHLDKNLKIARIVSWQIVTIGHGVEAIVEVELKAKSFYDDCQ